MKQKLILLLLLLSSVLQAQVFPVQVTPVVVPPYSVILSEYSNAFREQVVVNLLLSDISANRDVRLVFSLTSNTGINVQSAPVVIGASPFRLSGGIALRLSNADLQPYFQLENLVGISPQQYASPLPDGLYDFCFQVIDNRSGQAISRSTCAQAFIRQNDPPFLNYPKKGESIQETNPTNIVFNWTPRHLNATNVQYEFTLTELWDEGIDPQTAFFTSPPLFETTTNATTLLYGPSEPALLPNKNYGWRVRALVNDGISQTSTFKNNGYSEIWHFRHNGICRAPQFGLTVPKTATSQIVRWQFGEYTAYKVQYRKVGGSSSAWFEERATSFEEAVTIYNLEKNTTYEYRIGGQCRRGEDFVYGNIQQFTTVNSSEEAGGYQCGVLPDITITNQEPLERLGVNETFFAGDFPVTAKFVDQVATGRYTGVGYVTVPYLADTRILVKFENIAINTDKQLTNGIVETTYDPDWKGVDDVSDEIDTLVGIVKEIAGLFKRQQEILDEYKEETDPDKKESLLEEYNEAFVKTDDKIKELLDDPEVSEEDKKELRKVKDIDKIVDNDLSDKEVETYKKLNTQKAETVNEIAEKYNENKNDDPLLKLLIALQALDGDAFLKCKRCDEAKDQTIGVIDGSGFTYIKGNNSEKYFKCILGSFKDNTVTFTKLDTDKETTPEIQNEVNEQFNGIQSFLAFNDELLAVSNQNDWILCKSDLEFDNSYCSSSNTVSKKEQDRLVEELSNCLEDTAGTVASIETITYQLKLASIQLRNTQKAQFLFENKVYELNNLGIASPIENPLTKDQIISGSWTDASVESIFRLEYNEQGIIQTTIGIDNQLRNIHGISVNFRELSQSITNTTNTLFLDSGVTNLDQTIEELMVNLDSDLFPDHEKIAIDLKTKFLKLASESLGVTTTFLKTSQFEQQLYRKDQESTIKVPGLGTGTIEATGTKVSDLTSICTMVYGLATDKKVQEGIVKSFDDVKKEIKNNPKKVLPIFVETALTAATGVSKEEFEELKLETTDTGRRQHLASLGGTSTVITIITGAKILEKLPSIIKNVSIKLAKGKKVLKFTKLNGLSGDIVENFRKKINGLGGKADQFFDDFKDATQEQLRQIVEFDLLDAWKKFDEIGVDNSLKQNPGALDAYMKNLKGEKVPDPSTYLSKSYIDNHLAKFDEGAVRFTSDKYPTLGNNEAFVMPKSEFDDLMIETGGDLAEIEKKLVVKPGTLTGDNAVIAWVKKEDFNGNIKFPTGNEGGAWPGEWIPGGKTGGGVSEAILDLSDPNIKKTLFPF